MVTLRSCQKNDTGKMIEFLREHHSPHDENFYSITEADDMNLDHDIIERWLESQINDEHTFTLVALEDNNIIGRVEITSQKIKSMQHVAVMGIGILKKWRHNGLGYTMTKSAIEWAKNNQFIEMVLVYVFWENTPAISCLSKFGFVESGIIRNYYKKGDVYYDSLLMSLVV